METSAWTILIIGVVALLLLMTLIRSVSNRSRKGGTGSASGSTPDTVYVGPSVIDPAIVAIIVAAISAASGKPASGFRIATLERTGISTPVWGHIDRMARSPRGR